MFYQAFTALFAYLRISYGVPRGSILGQLLFLIHMNDLPSVSDIYIQHYVEVLPLVYKLYNFVILHCMRAYDNFINNKLLNGLNMISTYIIYL